MFDSADDVLFSGTLITFNLVSTLRNSSLILQIIRLECTQAGLMISTNGVIVSQFLHGASYLNQATLDRSLATCENHIGLLLAEVPTPCTRSGHSCLEFKA
ncbi:hypothetical protein AAHA92_07299 [Salvia divinorum]|uniref:Uncharacterized protein n=1 Tax=Salvia divinorum TaxID=28513 RepID=A0ABD1IBE2_SALDI